MEQMQLREELEACRTADDGLECCDAIEARLRHRASEIAAEFAASFVAGEWQQAQDYNRKMQFIQRLQQQLAELQFELEDF